VALAAALARDCPEVREVERAASRVVLLDEYQDTGAAQEVLLSSLFGDGHPVTAVGDPCQSIYGWRGASAGHAAPLPAGVRRAGVAPRTLSTTYRSGGRVLQLANRCRRSCAAEGVPVPRLRPRPAGRRRPGARRAAADVDAEAAWVAEQVDAALARCPDRRPALVAARRAVPQALDVRPAAPAFERGASRSRWSGSAAAHRARGRRRPRHPAGARRPHGRRRAAAAAHRAAVAARPRDLAALGRRARSWCAARGAPDDPVEAVVLGVDEAQRRLAGRRARRPAAPGRRTPCRRRGGAGSRPCATSWGPAPRADQPLPDLVADVERTLGLDVEVSARPRQHRPAAPAPTSTPSPTRRPVRGRHRPGRTGEAVLGAFLAHLEAAEDEEHGLDTGAVSGADTVKLMTVHAAKGLEWRWWPCRVWPAAPRNGAAVFPAKPATSTSWTPTPGCSPSRCAATAPSCPALDGLGKDEPRAAP
jgi:DNA helicase-2/ATP-dependent DNA helicase PcrA